jgi:hypothetical protein
LGAKHITIAISGSVWRTTSPSVIASAGFARSKPPWCPERLDISGDAELMRCLHEVVFGDGVALGDLGDRHEPVFLSARNIKKRSD